MGLDLRRVVPSPSSSADVLVTPLPAKPHERNGQRARRCWRAWFLALYNWMLWGFVVVIVFSQLLGVVWNSTSSTTHLSYGRSPLLGTFAILGQNDEPYSDRMLVCLLRGRLYRPVQLSAALAHPSTVLVDSTGSAVHGYRIVKRTGATFEQSAYALYSLVCDELAATLDALFDSCTALGYNITRDALRIVDDLDSSDMFLIHNSLPVLVMPYWDNAPYVHFVIPGWDGSACAFRIARKLMVTTDSSSTLFAPDRAVRERLTVEWLKRPGGAWRNGWYEDPSGSKWYSDMATTNLSAPLGITSRLFDISKNYERLGPSTESIDMPSSTWWGDKFNVVDMERGVVSVAISNGKRFGLFLYQNSPKRIVQCLYDLETFISNTTVLLLLVRWMVVMLTLQTTYWQGKCATFESAGIGCLANTRSFLLLPILLVPRLKQSLMAFFSAGCMFEGEQFAFSEAWFVVYPALVELMILYYSLLNLVARLVRRRMTDALFGPTLLLFSCIHYLRNEIAQSGLFEIDGRVMTLFRASDFESLTLFDFVSTSVALRINGNVQRLFALKIALLVVNLLPLLASESTSVKDRASSNDRPHQVEDVLAVRASCLGGIGATRHCGRKHSIQNASGSAPPLPLSSYELLRIGYVVLGDTYLVGLTDWVYFAAFSRHEWIRQMLTYRILVVRVKAAPRGFQVVAPAEFVLLNDARLRRVKVWHLSAPAFQ